MKYIITALKIEAQAFVDKYKLAKSKSNDDITVIVSGIGKSKMLETTKEIVKIMHNNDSILNVGICGAQKKFNIGDILPKEITLTCVDEPIDNPNLYEAVDMESAGFIDATKNVANSYIFKIVSDHFEPHMVTKDKTKKLIYDKIDEIMAKVDG